MKILEKTRTKLLKIEIGVCTFITSLLSFSPFALADVSLDGYDGGEILSDIGTPVKTIIGDVATTLQILIPILGVCVGLFYLFRYLTGDEQDQMRYKKSIVKVLIVIVIAELAVVLINLLTRYF